MCLIKSLNKTSFRFISLISIFAFGILHITIGFKRSVPDFNTYDLFNLSPFYDFYIDFICGKQTTTFYTWGGWKKTEFSWIDFKYVTKYYDVTDIKKINGNYFCYKKSTQTYLDLLSNGQIIKKGTECPEKYKKNCGRIDTLNQELCIKENEKCPLYDVGIGKQDDLDNYIYDVDYNIYYSKDNFNIQNKSIIAKLILSDGQPCYDSNKTLWKKFSSSETVASHLICTKVNISGKYNDDRYEKRGDITYKRLYKDNLNQRAQNEIMKSVGDDTVSLYKREFLGIDKTCDENYNSTGDFNSLKFIQNADRIIELVQGFFMLFAGFIFIIFEIISCRDDVDDKLIPSIVYFWFYVSYIFISCGFLISKIIAFNRAKKFDYSDGYNCSDPITNEHIRIGNENNKKTFTYNKICLFSEIAIIGINFFVVLIGLIWDLINYLMEKNRQNKAQTYYNEPPAVEIPYANYPSYPTDN